MRCFLLLFSVCYTLFVNAVVAEPLQAGSPYEVVPTGCILAERHVPAPNVAYQAGIDVRGEPVVPADLPGTHRTIELPDTYDFELRVPVDERFSPETDLNVGVVTIDPKTNRLSWNGRVMTPLEGTDTIPLCPLP